MLLKKSIFAALITFFCSSSVFAQCLPDNYKGVDIISLHDLSTCTNRELDDIESYLNEKIDFIRSRKIEAIDYVSDSGSSLDKLASITAMNSTSTMFNDLRVLSLMLRIEKQARAASED